MNVLAYLALFIVFLFVLITTYYLLKELYLWLAHIVLTKVPLRIFQDMECARLQEELIVEAEDEI
jgi:hypothetical protein